MSAPLSQMLRALSKALDREAAAAAHEAEQDEGAMRDSAYDRSYLLRSLCSACNEAAEDLDDQARKLADRVQS